MHTLTLHDPDQLAMFPQRATGLHMNNHQRALSPAELDLLPSTLEHLSMVTLDAPDLSPIASRFPALRTLSLDLQGMTSEQALAPLAALTQLGEVELGLNNQPAPDLSALAKVHTVNLNRVNTHSGLAARLGALRAVRALTLYLPEEDGGMLAAIAALPALEHLRLVSVTKQPRKADALVALASAPALRTLELENIQQDLSAVEVAALAAHPTLTSVLTEVNSIKGVRELEGLHERMERLQIKLPRQLMITDALLLELAQTLPGIRALEMGEASAHKVTSRGFETLGKLTRLEWLSTGALPSGIKHESLAWLAAQGSLRHLSITSRSVGAKLADTLKRCVGLRTLELREVKLSDGAAKKLTKLKLEALGLHQVPLTDKGLEAVAQIKTLRTLCLLLDKGQLGDAGLAALATLPALETLHLHHWYSKCGLTTLAPLARMTQLKQLSAPSFDGSLASLAGAPELWWLSVSQGDDTMDAATARALGGLPNLLHLQGITTIREELGDHVLRTYERGSAPPVMPPMRAFS